MARGVQKHTGGSFFLLRRLMRGRCGSAKAARGVPRRRHAGGSFFCAHPTQLKEASGALPWLAILDMVWP